jgi:hypothetical protein
VRRAVVATIVAGLVGGCATTKDVQARLYQRYYGEPVASFFAANELPVGAFAAGGETLYEWSSGVRVTTMPVTAQTTVIGNQAFTNVSGGQRVTKVCRISLTADSSGKIIRLAILEDTFGAGSLSRCDDTVR